MRFVKKEKKNLGRKKYIHFCCTLFLEPGNDLLYSRNLWRKAFATHSKANCYRALKVLCCSSRSCCCRSGLIKWAMTSLQTMSLLNKHTHTRVCRGLKTTKIKIGSYTILKWISLLFSAMRPTLLSENLQFSYCCNESDTGGHAQFLLWIALLNPSRYWSVQNRRASMHEGGKWKAPLEMI